MKIEVTNKELNILIGLVYESMNKQKELLHLIGSNINQEIDVKKIQNEVFYFENLFDKLSSQLRV